MLVDWRPYGLEPWYRFVWLWLDLFCTCFEAFITRPSWRCLATEEHTTFCSNSKSKQVASMDTVFGIIAYITTGDVSALEAVSYLRKVTAPNFDIWQGLGIYLSHGVLLRLHQLWIKRVSDTCKGHLGHACCDIDRPFCFGNFAFIFNPGKLMMNYDVSTPSYPSVDMEGTVVEQ